MATKKPGHALRDPQGITLRKYGKLIREKWPLNKGYVIGAKYVGRAIKATEKTQPIHEWKLQWTLTAGAGNGNKGHRVTPSGGRCTSTEQGAVFSTVQEAYLFYYKISGAKPSRAGLPPKADPPVSALRYDYAIQPELPDIFDEMMGAKKPPKKPSKKPVENKPSIDVLDEKPFKETRTVSGFSPLKNRAQELLHSHTLMGSDLDALEQEMRSFSVVFNSTPELRTTAEARLLALAVAGKLTPTELEEKLGIPKRDSYRFKHKETGISISLVGASFRCTSCDLDKPGSAFGIRRMQDGTFRNQSQCGECRSVNEYNRLEVVSSS